MTSRIWNCRSFWASDHVAVTGEMGYANAQPMETQVRPESVTGWQPKKGYDTSFKKLTCQLSGLQGDVCGASVPSLPARPSADVLRFSAPQPRAQRGEASSSPTPRAALRSNARRSTGRDRDTGIVARDRRPAAPNRSPVEGYPANLQRQRPKSRYGSCALRRFSRRRRARSACRSIATR